MKQILKTNEELVNLIHELKKLSNEKKLPIWKRVASELEKPTRQRRVVNISKLNRFSKKDDVLIVPGKVLSSGELDHNITVVAFDFSKGAQDKIKAAKGKSVRISEFIKKNAQEKSMKIIG